MIVSSNQDVLASWLCSKIHLCPSTNLRCIGRLNSKGRIIGVVGYDSFTGTSAVIHVAGEGNWLSKDLLWAAFDYPFNRCGLKVLFAHISSANKSSLRFNLHLGFKREHVLRDAYPDGDAIITSLRAEDCKYLKRKHHGQVV